VLRSDFKVDVADQTSRAWSQDGREIRIIARVAAVIPVPSQAARSLTIGAGTTRTAKKAA
jgi:hypothetical protein